jgi:PAS domain S-box-containing protein
LAEMNDWDKSKAQLIEELTALRAEVATLRQQSFADSSRKPIQPQLCVEIPRTAGWGGTIDYRNGETAEFHQLLEKLQKCEFTWQTVQSIAHVGSWQYDFLTETVSWSDGVYRILDSDPTLPPSQRETLEQYIHPDDRERYREAIGQARGGESFEIELRILRPSGEIRYVEVRGEPRVIDKQGRLILVIGTLLDVTERRQAELYLKESNAMLAALGDNIPKGFLYQIIQEPSLDFCFKYLSAGIKQVLGITAEAVLQDKKVLYELILEEDRQHHDQLNEYCFKTLSPFEMEMRIRRVTGELKWFSVRSIPRYIEGGAIVWDGVCVDITDLKRVEAALRKSEAKMQAMLQAIPDMLIQASKDGLQLFFSPGTLTPYIPAEPFEEKSFYDILPVDVVDQRMEYVRRAIETRELQVFELDIPINGRIEHRETRVAAINDSEAIIVVRDMTERHRLEQAKDEFISMVSHELRTPLTSMQVALSLLDDGLVDPVSEDWRTMIHIATEGVDRLVRLVNDILDLNRLESGKLYIQKHVCQTQDVIDAAIQQMQDLASQSNITIIPSGESYEVWADYDRIVQVLINLLSNAIRFSNPRAMVWVNVKEWSGKALLFSVKDQGRGIPADKLGSIFERFQQADVSDSREKSGTGLGLTICQEIVKQHGGGIWVESRLGQGSTFYFTVPVEEGKDHAK